MPSATNLISLPRPARMSDATTQGRLAALRAYSAAVESKMSNEDFIAVTEKVMHGPAPEAFKDAYAHVILTLSATFNAAA